MLPYSLCLYMLYATQLFILKVGLYRYTNQKGTQVVMYSIVLATTNKSPTSLQWYTNVYHGQVNGKSMQNIGKGQSFAHKQGSCNFKYK